MAELTTVSGGSTNVNASLLGADETSPQSITLYVEGRFVLEVYASATSPTNFFLDVSLDGSTWIEGFDSWTSTTKVKAGYMNAFPWVRLRSAAAGGAGDKVNLILTASG